MSNMQIYVFRAQFFNPNKLLIAEESKLFISSVCKYLYSYQPASNHSTSHTAKVSILQFPINMLYV